MEVHTMRKSAEVVNKCSETDQTHHLSSSKTVKRPFDVAFLMLPDEKLKQKQKLLKEIETASAAAAAAASKYNNNNNNIDDDDEGDDEDEDVDIEENGYETNKLNRPSASSAYFTQKQQIFDDPNLIKNKNYEALRKSSSSSSTSALSTPVIEQKSAFTKVNLNKNPRISPNLSLSPSDISYQNSLSPSPPIIVNRHQYQSFPSNLLPSQNQIFKSSTQQPFTVYPANFNQENFQQNLRYRQEIPYNYHHHQHHHHQHQFHNNQDILKIAAPTNDISRHPSAAAIFTSLLPPSLAALSLPGQNVCAKCNITFRMTSDLVYHMRSHHKNDSNDMTKRRREEKLKCPVCSESFRERHHLTRHMTAHQDKDDDEKEMKKEPVV